MNATDFLKALSDPTRLSLVVSLRDRQGSKNESMCVCDLTTLLGQPQPTVSRHLNHLKRTGILLSERKGTWMWYKLNQQIPEWCQQIIDLIEIDAKLERKLTANGKKLDVSCCGKPNQNDDLNDERDNDALAKACC